jgi:hypothetical protein
MPPHLWRSPRLSIFLSNFEALIRQVTENHLNLVKIMTVRSSISAIFMGVGQMLGTAGPPHIFIFLSVADAQAAPRSVFYAMAPIGHLVDLVITLAAIDAVRKRAIGRKVGDGVNGASDKMNEGFFWLRRGVGRGRHAHGRSRSRPRLCSSGVDQFPCARGVNVLARHDDAGRIDRRLRQEGAQRPRRTPTSPFNRLASLSGVGLTRNSFRANTAGSIARILGAQFMGSA